MNKIISPLVVSILALSLVSCSYFKKTQTVFNAGDNRTTILAFGNFTQTAIGGSSGSITYKSDNLEVATVNMSTGEVTPLSLGTVTITATRGGDDSYKAISDEYTVKVVDKPLLKVALNSIRVFKFSWFKTQAKSHQLLEDPDGSGSFSQVGEDLLEGETAFDLSVILYKRVNARYKIISCKGTENCVESDPISVDVSNLMGGIGYLKASNTGEDDGFGTSVSLSDDGRTLAIGTDGEDSNATGVNEDEENNLASGAGAVYVFTRTGVIWTQQAYIKASNTSEGDNFGTSMSLSGDGNTLAVGANDESSNATGVNKDEGDNSVSDSGAVYVFTRIETNGEASWIQQAYIKASNTGEDDYFGTSISLSGDGNTLAVGASGEDSNVEGVNEDEENNLASGSGAVYVFTRTETNGGVSWAQQAYIKASNTGEGDEFGTSMSLNSDGSTLAVGVDREDSNAEGVNEDEESNLANGAGAVYVFTRTGTSWAQQAYIKASNTDKFDDFGTSVSLSGDGNTLAVGAMGEGSSVRGVNGNESDNSANNAGAVYVFTRTGTSWTQQVYIKASNTGGSDLFGTSVSLSGDGNTLAVGASSEDSNATGVSGDESDNSVSNSGVVYLY